MSAYFLSVSFPPIIWMLLTCSRFCSWTKPRSIPSLNLRINFGPVAVRSSRFNCCRLHFLVNTGDHEIITLTTLQSATTQRTTQRRSGSSSARNCWIAGGRSNCLKRLTMAHWSGFQMFPVALVVKKKRHWPLGVSHPQKSAWWFGCSC